MFLPVPFDFSSLLSLFLKKRERERPCPLLHSNQKGKGGMCPASARNPKVLADS